MGKMKSVGGKLPDQALSRIGNGESAFCMWFGRLRRIEELEAGRLPDGPERDSAATWLVLDSWHPITLRRDAAATSGTFPALFRIG